MNLYNPYDPAAFPIVSAANGGSGREPRVRPQHLPPGWHLDVMAVGPLSAGQWYDPPGIPTQLKTHRITPRHYQFEFEFPPTLVGDLRVVLSGGEIAFSFGAAVVERLPFNAPLDEVERAIAAAGKAAGFGPVLASALRTRGQGLDIRFRIPGFPEFNFPPLEMFSSCTAGGTAISATVMGGHTLAWIGHWGRRGELPPNLPAHLLPAMQALVRDQITSAGEGISAAPVPRWVSQPVYGSGAITSPEHWFFGFELPYVHWAADDHWEEWNTPSWALALTPSYADGLPDYGQSDDLVFQIAPFEEASWNGQALKVGPKVNHGMSAGPPSPLQYFELPDFLTLRPLYVFAMDEMYDGHLPAL